MRLLDHPNIIKIFEIFEDDTEYYIVMEYCQGGELYEKIKQHKTFPERECADILRQLICVISFLHSKRIAHRDVKPENIMLEERASEISLRLCDFGEATHLNDDGHCVGYCGTSYYLPPEIANNQPYTEKCDI